MILFAAVVLAAFATPLTTPLRGTVVDREGRPVAGATVWLLERTSIRRCSCRGRGPFGSTRAGSHLTGRPIWPTNTGSIGDRRRPAISRSILRVIPPARSHDGRYRSGRFGRECRLLSRSSQETCRGPDQPVRLVLGAPARTEIRVKDPDLRPVAGARIKVSRLRSDILAIPEPLADRIEVSTDAEGRAVLDAFAAERVAEVEVAAQGLGIQRCAFLPTVEGPKLIWLGAGRQGFWPAHGGRSPCTWGWTIWAATAPADKSAESRRQLHRHGPRHYRRRGPIRDSGDRRGILDHFLPASRRRCPTGSGTFPAP